MSALAVLSITEASFHQASYDIIASVSYFLNLSMESAETDDIDKESVGSFWVVPCGFGKWKIIRERTEDATLSCNVLPEFFGSSPAVTVYGSENNTLAQSRTQGTFRTWTWWSFKLDFRVSFTLHTTAWAFT